MKILKLVGIALGVVLLLIGGVASIAAYKTVQQDREIDADLAYRSAHAAGRAAPPPPVRQAASTTLVSLAKFGLKTDAPAGSTVGPALIGDGLMIEGPDLIVTIEPAKNRPKTLVEAKKDAAMFTPANLLAETLPDGWSLAFENTGAAGTNYFVRARREIGKKPYWCDTTASNPAQQSNALRACKGLRP